MQFAHHESAITLTAWVMFQEMVSYSCYILGSYEKRVQLKMQCELIIFSQSASVVDLLISLRLITRAS